MTISKEDLNKEYERLQLLANRLEKVISSSPEGTIYQKDANSDTWYISVKENGRRVRKPSHDKELIEQLKKKKVATFLLSRIKKNLSIIERTQSLRDHDVCTVSAKLGAEYADCAKELLSIRETSNNAFNSLKERQNPSHPENLNVITELGAFRSKTEALIAYILTMLGIVFKYEAPLFVNGEIIYPDFTILHPITGEIYYLEHFGLLSKKFYRDRMVERLAAYSDAGINVGQQLLITSESGDGGIDARNIRKLLCAYFL